MNKFLHLPTLVRVYVGSLYVTVPTGVMCTSNDPNMKHCTDKTSLGAFMGVIYPVFPIWTASFYYKLNFSNGSRPDLQQE